MRREKGFAAKAAATIGILGIRSEAPGNAAALGRRLFRGDGSMMGAIYHEVAYSGEKFSFLIGEKEPR